MRGMEKKEVGMIIALINREIGIATCNLKAVPFKYVSSREDIRC